MDLTSMKKIWQSSNEAMDLKNVTNAHSIMLAKNSVLKRAISKMKWMKLFIIVCGIIWLSIGSTIIINLFITAYDRVSHYFLYSMALQLIITASALIIYFYQMFLLYQMDTTMSVVQTQSKPGRSKSDFLVDRTLFFFCSYPYGLPFI